MTTLPDSNLLVSFILSTHNRRHVLLGTLGQLMQCGLRSDEFEVFVVDDASTDGTCGAVATAFPTVLLLPQRSNCGACAKNIALPQARGRFVVFLDDDSFPQPDSIARMIAHFQRDPRLGAAVFTIHLPDGSRECSAYPNVFIGCGTGFRKRALVEVGGLPNDFFMQAEEYDLSLRLLNNGWRVKSFDDLHVTHLKTPAARRAERVMRLDVRNNLVLATRYFPRKWARSFARDWLTRYYKIAASKNQRLAFAAGAIQGVIKSSFARRSDVISDAAFESFAKVGEIERRLGVARELLDLRSIVFIDLGKNVLPFWLAAQKLRIKVVAIADQRLAGQKYRGVRIVSDTVARTYAFDAALVANLSPVQAAHRRIAWRDAEHHRPVIDLFEIGAPWDVDLERPVPVDQTLSLIGTV